MDIEKIFSRINLLFTTVAAAFALFMTFQFTAVEKRLGVQASQIANNKSNIELQQSQTKFDREFKLSLLSELNKALNTQQKDTLYCTVAVAFVRDMLADDPMKTSIMEVFEHSNFVPKKIKQKIQEERIQEQTFKIEDDAVKVEVETNAKQPESKKVEKTRVDVFYVENLNEVSNKKAADAIAAKLNSNPSYTARARQLPASVNLRSGYKVAENELRYDTGEEDTAQKLLDILNKETKNKFELRLTSNITSGYVSVFVANQN